MKKLLCLILTLAVVLTSFSFCLPALAAENSDGRSGSAVSAVEKVLNPILASDRDKEKTTYYSEDTLFADSINEIGYDSIDNLTYSLTKENFDDFIKVNADDEMLGIDYDFLYSKNSGPFFWAFLYRKLEVDLTSTDKTSAEYKRADQLINSVISSAGASVTAADFRNTWNEKHPGVQFTIHDVEIYAANAAGKRTTCCKKGDYDACAEVINGFDYNYAQKTTDTKTFNKIVETKVQVYNEYTRKTEVHYDYSYDLTKSSIALMTANSENQIINTLCKNLTVANLYKTTQDANENAVKIANFIRELVNPDRAEIKAGTKVFTDNKLTAEKFFKKITEISGLETILQDNWCETNEFNVKEVMSALGVDVADTSILDVELEKGSSMGARILTDMFRGFYKNPVNYVENLVQLLCKGYSYSFSKAIKSLFSIRYPMMQAASRSGNYPELDYYTGDELDSVDGLINFIADCLYVTNVNKAKAEGKSASSVKKFNFAPLPVNRIVTAADADERHLYYLCYYDINRKFEDNASMIWNESVTQKGFINKLMDKLTSDYEAAEDSDVATVVAETEKVLRAMFAGELTLVDVITFYTDKLTQNIIENFDFASKIKNAIASIFQRFIDAMDGIMKFFFGWTEGLFDKIEK